MKPGRLVWILGWDQCPLLTPCLIWPHNQIRHSSLVRVQELKGGDSQHRSITRSEKFFGKKLMNSAPCSLGKAPKNPRRGCLCFPAAVGFTAGGVQCHHHVRPFFLGKIIDTSSTQTPLQTAAPASTRLCLAPERVPVRCRSNAVRVYLMQTSGAGTLLLGGLGGGRVGSRGLPVLLAPPGWGPW